MRQENVSLNDTEKRSFDIVRYKKNNRQEFLAFKEEKQNNGEKRQICTRVSSGYDNSYEKPEHILLELRKLCLHLIRLSFILYSEGTNAWRIASETYVRLNHQEPQNLRNQIRIATHAEGKLENTNIKSEEKNVEKKKRMTSQS